MYERHEGGHAVIDMQDSDQRLAAAAERYFDDNSFNVSHFELIGDEITENATPAYLENTKPGLLVLAPVALHQERAYIETALEQYEHQKDAPQHRIILFANSPEFVTEDQAEQAEQTLTVIKQFRDEHPELPISYFDKTVSLNTPIGEIRYWLFGSSLYALRSSDTDFLVLNHDIDTLLLDKRHFDTM